MNLARPHGKPGRALCGSAHPENADGFEPQHRQRHAHGLHRLGQPIQGAVGQPDQRRAALVELLSGAGAVLTEDAARADLASAAVIVRRYADGSSRKTTQMLQLLEQSGSQLQASEMPRLEGSLPALATAAAGR